MHAYIERFTKTHACSIANETMREVTACVTSYAAIIYTHTHTHIMNVSRVSYNCYITADNSTSIILYDMSPKLIYTSLASLIKTMLHIIIV